MGGEMRENTIDDQEFDMLLNEIPHATSHNVHHHMHPQHSNHHHHAYSRYGHGHGHGSSVAQKISGLYNGMYYMYDDDTLSYTCASPVSGFSLQSGGSSSSLFSGGYAVSDTGSPTPPPLEELKSHVLYGSSNYPNGFWVESKIPDSPVREKGNESLMDELGLCRNPSKMYISNEQEDGSKFGGSPVRQYGFQFRGSNKAINIANYGACRDFGNGVSDCTGLQSNEKVDASNFRGYPVDQFGFQFSSSSMNGSNGINSEKYEANHNFGRVDSDYIGLQSPGRRTPTRFDGEMSTALSGLQQEYGMSNLLGLQSPTGQSDALFSQLNFCSIPLSSSLQKSKEQPINYYPTGSPPSNLMNSLSRLSMADSLFHAQRNGVNLNEDRAVLSSLHLLHHGMPISNGKTRAPSTFRMPQGGLEAFTDEDSFVIQGEGLSYLTNKRLDHTRGQYKGSSDDSGVRKHLERRSQLDSRPQVAVTCENARNARTYLPPRYNSLAEAQGYIYLIAKDQNGCRFLQRMFEEGTARDVQIIFNEIIDHVVELMMNPFGNYLMQKLLDVCTEEQRMQILLVITKQPGELIRISLNMHGTRVVQKLIETLKTRQQISLVISALEPGFHSLMIDVNGNHVVQRCLQCLSNADNKLIFIAAAKYCVDIGTHQHGCCVLQRCISHSTGQYRENLVAEISSNGLLLAQDSFGNYVVQFILELKIPSATSNLISQFEGNYVHLSTHRFSSHVVEKCLTVFNEKNRSRIIHELLSSSHFERLLQDPHANYVIQTALRVSEGTLQNSLVEVIEAHRGVARNSPYAKKIFSLKLLKK